MPKALVEKTRFYQMLFTGYRAGLPMDVLLKSVLVDGKSDFAAVADTVTKQGKPLSSALLARKLIAPWEARLLGVGEASGRLDAMLQELMQFHEDRLQQFRETGSRLVYPVIVVLCVIFVLPIPGLALGSVTATQYLLAAGIKSFFLYCAYRVLFVLPMSKSASAAFNPLISLMLKFTGNRGFIREMFEVSYLNLLVLCLESGMDAVETLKLLRDGKSDRQYRSAHSNAIRAIGDSGLGLTLALNVNGIITNPAIIGFMNTSEHTGTLHSDLKKFVQRKKSELRTELNFRIRKAGNWFYFGVLFYAAFSIVGS
jgi:type II secretory pathway component PulF